MKPRKWVIIVGLLLIAASSALYQASILLGRSRNLERLLIQGVSPYIPGSFEVEKVRIGFFSVHLKQVTVSLPAHAFAIALKDIKIGFSFIKLIRCRGDFARAISRVILVNPAIDISLWPTHGAHEISGGAVTQPRIMQLLLPRELPVNHLLVKKGVVRLIDRNGNATILGEQLNGKIWDTGTEMPLELTGKLGSSHNNLSVRGTISLNGSDRHRISWHMDSVEIRKPIVVQEITIAAGKLSGAAEVSFPDTVSPSTLEIDGYIRIDKGICRIGKSAQPVDSLKMRLTMNGSLLSIDTLSGYWSGASAQVSGKWDIAHTDSTELDFACSGLSADSLLGHLPDSVRSNIVGSGWVRGSVRLAGSGAGSPGFRLNMAGGGISAWGIPVADIRTALTFAGKKTVVDALSLRGPGFLVQAEGSIDYAVRPVGYTGNFSAVIDSFPLIKDIAGRVRVTGAIDGQGSSPGISVTARGKGIRLFDIQLGNPDLLVIAKNGRVTFSTRDSVGAEFRVSGSIERPFTKTPIAQCAIKIGSRPIISMLKRKPVLPHPDSVWIDATAGGWVDSFDVLADAQIRSAVMRGGAILSMSKRPKKELVGWKIVSKNFMACDSAMTFGALGKLYKDSLVIDSVSVLRSVTGVGKVFLAAQPVRIESRLTCNLDVTALKQFMRKAPVQLEKGRISGNVRLSGSVDRIESRAELRLRGGAIAGITGLQTDAVISTVGETFTVLPMVIRKDGKVAASLDTITNAGSVRFSGQFDNLEIASLLDPVASENLDIKGLISGGFSSSPKGFPVSVEIRSRAITINKKWQIDSVQMSGGVVASGLDIKQLRAKDGPRSTIAASGFLPWSMLGNEQLDVDTLRAQIRIDGDLLASIQKNFDSPVGGTGQGHVDVAFYGVPGSGSWHFTRGALSVPGGVLRVRPFVLDDTKIIGINMRIDESGRIHTDLSGTVRRRPIRIFSTHDLPEGYEPLQFGPVSLGMILVETPKRGIDLHLPGFMEIGERGDVEFAPKKPFKYFALSGPFDKLKITGTWIVRNMEFTFPFLNTNELHWDFDPFPYIAWEFDLKAGDRNVMYFWDLVGKRGRRLMRFVEGFIDPTSSVRIRGRDLDKTFRIYGQIRSYKGAAYYGKVFDRQFDVGVEFSPVKPSENRGYDNLPVLWGTAEAFADSSRFDRIKLTLLVHDPITNGIAERGRLVEGPTLNVSFHLSSTFEELPGEQEREFYRQAGLRFTTIEGAGGLVSDFGEQYLHRYFLQRLERRLARTIGLDVINIESSIASNYFNKLYNRQFDGLVNQDDYLALANVGVTVGRYFFRDNLFLKARGELIPIDTALTPEYSVGMEIQPTRYFLMDFNYGIHRGEYAFEHNPRVNMQLRLPITRLRNILNF